MPLSRSRKLTPRQKKNAVKTRQYRQSVHRARVALLCGDITKEQHDQFRAFALARLNGQVKVVNEGAGVEVTNHG